MMQKNDLLTRAVEQIMPRELAEEKLRNGKPLRAYLGIDPTGNRLHLGHTVPLRKLQAFADAGHHAIFVVGSFTATIGDPTGQDTARAPLTKVQVEENFLTYKRQAAKILNFDKVEIRYNHEWLEKLTSLEMLKIASHFTVQQMLQRDMFRERVKRKEDLNPTEFLYPLLQGYDSVVLDVDCEIGGNDQLFNMLCGRKLQKRYGKREKFVLTTKLIEGLDGRKMSKTFENCVYLEDAPNDMYGKLMSLQDNLMATYFECCTDIPTKEYQKLLKDNARDTKASLAREIVTLYHGSQAAESAEKEFTSVFSEGKIPENIPELRVKKGTPLIDALVESGLVSSKSDARRLIEQKGIELNKKVVQKIDAKVEEGIVRVGKRKFLQLRI